MGVEVEMEMVSFLGYCGRWGVKKIPAQGFG